MQQQTSPESPENHLRAFEETDNIKEFHPKPGSHLRRFSNTHNEESSSDSEALKK